VIRSIFQICVAEIEEVREGGEGGAERGRGEEGSANIAEGQDNPAKR
jgi:hypothetical protein